MTSPHRPDDGSLADGRTPGMLRRIPVELGERRYEVIVGDGARHALAEFLPARSDRAVVVTQAGIGVDVDPGVPFEVVTIDDGEGVKSLATVERLCRRFSRAGLSRHDAVIAVGGGVVTDVVGFAASTYFRGIAYVNVATTLLGQVDAAIGGKTGVNIPEGKNLVGTFWQPSAVLCDTEVLATLPPREWSCGRGEMAKYAFLSTAALPGDTGAGGAAVDTGAGGAAVDTGAGGAAVDTDAGGAAAAVGAGLLELSLPEQVAWCAAVKASVVAADEREGGRRMVLNYGHTLAHALEAAAFGPDGRWDLRHGEAVAIGLVFAALLARRLDRIDDDRVVEHRRVVASFDLPADLPDGADPVELAGFMAHDKKAHHDLTFVLDGPRGVEPVHGVDRADVMATLAFMTAARTSGR